MDIESWATNEGYDLTIVAKNSGLGSVHNKQNRQSLYKWVNISISPNLDLFNRKNSPNGTKTYEFLSDQNKSLEGNEQLNYNAFSPNRFFNQIKSTVKPKNVKLKSISPDRVKLSELNTHRI